MTDNDIRGLQIFYWVQIIGASLCLCFTLGFNTWAIQRGMMPTPERLRAVTVISIFAGVGSVALWVVAHFRFQQILSRITGSGGMADVSLVRRAYTMRIALFQGAAILGLVALLIGGLMDALNAHPFFWLMAVPYGALIGLAIGTFPTRAAVRGMLQTPG